MCSSLLGLLPCLVLAACMKPPQPADVFTTDDRAVLRAILTPDSVPDWPGERWLAVGAEPDALIPETFGVDSSDVARRPSRITGGATKVARRWTV
jgi:hypothetical protein